MGLLEYQAVPSLCEVAHDGYTVYIYNITAEGNSISSHLGISCQGNQYGTKKADVTVIKDKITPAGSLSSSQPGGPPCWFSPLAFGLIDRKWRLAPSRGG